MAVVKIWKITSSLKHVVNYVEDEEKTRSSNYKDLDDLLRYTKNGDKTEDTFYVTGINCDPKNATNEMLDIKRKFSKEKGVLAWHAYQSFKEGEVTPSEAHKIGLELANEMWGDKFQVVVTTHLNTNHYHNHFVVNSVSFIDGKKYNANRYSYAEFRKLNDIICMEHNKSHLEEKPTKSGINYKHYQDASTKYSNYYKTAKEDLDLSISKAYTFDEFLRILKNLGYEVIFRSGKLSIRGKEYKRNIRVERYFGDDYSIDNIKKRISKNFVIRKNTNYKRKSSQSIISILLKPKYNSFYSMYLRYCNLLNNYPDYINKKNIPKSLKEDIKKLDMFNKQTILLVNNNLETKEDFFHFLNKKVNKLSLLKQEREDLWKKYKKSDTETKKNIRNIIKNKSIKIKELNEEIKLCEDIKLRHNDIEENIRALEGKEIDYYEHIR